MLILMVVISLIAPTNSQDIELERRSVIKFGWGMMFDYYGQMLHGLNKYNLIVGVKVPTINDLNLQIPYMLQPSVCKAFPSQNIYKYVTWYSASDKNSVARPICDSLIESQGQMKNRLERVKEDIHSLVNEKIPFVLKRFRYEEPDTEFRTTTPSYLQRRDKYEQFKSKRLRKRRFISQLIGLRIQGISAYLEYRKTSRFEKGLHQLMQHNTLQDKEIRAIRKDMMSLTKATLRDLIDLKYDVRHHGEMINRLTREVDRLIPQLKSITGFLYDLSRGMYLFNGYFTQVYSQLNRYLDLFKEIKHELQGFLQAVEMVGMNRLSTGLITNQKMREMIDHVKEQLSENYPNFELVTDNEQDYYQMPLISAVYAKDMIVLQIPIYIKPITQKPLLMYKIKTIPVPYHINEKMIDSTESNYTYTEIINTAEMIAMSDETYVDVKLDDLDQCIRISTVYFCERLMLIKHRSQHTCESAIYHNVAPEIVKEKCVIRYYTHLDPKPMMIDSGDMLLLGNLPRPWITRCDKNIQIPETLQAGSYVIVYKHELCECSIMAGNPVWKVERNINYCRENTTQIHLYHTVNMAVMIYQFQKEIQSMQLSADTLSPMPIELDPEEPTFQEAHNSEIAKEQGKPLLLEEAMSSITETKYLSGEDYVLAMNKMSKWFTESNGTLGFMFVACIIVIVLVPLVIVILVKYFGLKVHFGKMNSTLSKLVTTATALRSIATTEAAKIVQDTDAEVRLNQFHVTDLSINAIFAYEVLLILLVTYGFYKIFVSLYRWYNFHNLGFAQTQETLYKYLLFDKTDIFIQLTKTFGAHTVQIHLGTFFGNPEDIKITGKLSDIYPLELEQGYLLDILSFNWNSFILNLRGMPLVLPLSKTLTGFNRLLIRNIFKSPHGMYKIIACNKSLCHLTVLQPYTKILNQPTKRRPTKPTRLNLIEPMYMDMANTLASQTPILFTNKNIESSQYNSNMNSNFNRSCVPLDCANGTSLVRDFTSLPTARMGDHSRSPNLDRSQQQAEVGDRQPVPRCGDPDSEVERVDIGGRGEGPHPVTDETVGNPVRE